MIRRRLTVAGILDLLLQAVDADAHSAEFLRYGVGNVHVVEVVDANTIPFDDAGRGAYGGTVCGNVFQNYGACGDLYVVAYGEGAQKLRVGTDENVVSDGRVPFSRFLSRAAQCDTVVNGAVVSDLSGFADDDTHAVVDEQPFSDGRTRVYLDARAAAGVLRDHTGEKLMVMAVKEFCDSMIDQNVQARVTEKDFCIGFCGGISFSNGLNIVAQFFEHTEFVSLSDTAHRP